MYAPDRSISSSAGSTPVKVMKPNYCKYTCESREVILLYKHQGQWNHTACCTNTWGNDSLNHTAVQTPGAMKAVQTPRAVTVWNHTAVQTPGAMRPLVCPPSHTFGAHSIFVCDQVGQGCTHTLVGWLDLVCKLQIVATVFVNHWLLLLFVYIIDCCCTVIVAAVCV